MLNEELDNATSELFPVRPEDFPETETPGPDLAGARLVRNIELRVNRVQKSKTFLIILKFPMQVVWCTRQRCRWPWMWNARANRKPGPRF